MKGEVFAYVGLPQILEDLKHAKGEVFAYVGLPQNLKDLKDHAMIRTALPSWIKRVSVARALIS